LHKDSLLKLTEGKLKVLETKQKAITSLRKGVLKVTDPVSRKDIRITFLENVSPEDVGQGFYARFGEADVKEVERLMDEFCERISKRTWCADYGGGKNVEAFFGSMERACCRAGTDFGARPGIDDYKFRVHMSGDRMSKFTAKRFDETFFHEMGHAVEHSNKKAQQAIQRFHAERTRGEESISLRKATGDKNYDPTEYCKQDKYPHPYCGKEYGDGSTELLSMGMQFLEEDPIKFAKADPEYFNLIVKILKGDF